LADEPWWLDATPEAYRKARWEQKVMAWLNRTQPLEAARQLIWAYMVRDPWAIATFERASALMRKEEVREHAPRRGPVDWGELSREHMARYPKIRRRLAE
jgi:hypothetical protein